MRIYQAERSIKKYILWGATGQAKVLRETLLDKDLIAIFDNDADISSPFTDVPLFFGRRGLEEWLKIQSDMEEKGFLVAIGGDKGKDRLEIHKQLEYSGFRPLVAIHRNAFVANNAVVGSGSQILANAAVCVDVVVGRCCIINTCASVDHESVLGDGVHICPGARLAGLVQVDNFATIYSGAVIVPRITIGEGAIVGAGAVVINDVPPYTMVAGNPARIIRTFNSEGDK